MYSEHVAAAWGLMLSAQRLKKSERVEVEYSRDLSRLENSIQLKFESETWNFKSNWKLQIVSVRPVFGINGCADLKLNLASDCVDEIEFEKQSKLD